MKPIQIHSPHDMQLDEVEPHAPGPRGVVLKGAMIAHRFPLEDFAEALLAAQDPGASGNVTIEIGEGTS